MRSKIPYTLVLSFLLFTTCKMSTSRSDGPNIVLFFVDDLGWADVGYRNPIFETPNIDQLKKDGVEFTRAYIGTPTCSPSRASLLTGKDAVRMQMVRHITHEDHQTGRNKSEYNYRQKDPANIHSRNWLPLEEVTYAEQLTQYGYYNMFIGKWHLGHEPYHPVHQGFHEQIGTSNWGHPSNYYHPFFNHLTPLKESNQGDYLTDVLTHEAIDFISAYNREEPFMLSMWYYSVHSPHIGKKELVDSLKDQGYDAKFANYLAMVHSVDESVGKIREALYNKGFFENTVILFLSDQGGAFKNGPLKGGKFGGQTLCEGGARVPFIVYYPGVTTAGGEVHDPVSSIDVFPTLTEIASGKNKITARINGKSLLPLLRGKQMNERNLFFYRSYENQYAAIIQGNYKLLKYRNGDYELFNLETDIGESNDIKGQNIELTTKLLVELERWENDATKEFYKSDNR